MNAVQTLAAEPWVGRLGWALIHFLWQGGLIASVYAIARIGLIQPRVRYFLACAALLAMIAAPIATFVRDVPSGSVPHRAAHSRAVSSIPSEWSTTPIASSVDPGHSSWLDSVMPWFVTAWFVGTVMLWLRFTAECILVTRIRSTSASVAGAEWQRTIQKLGERIRISRPVGLLTSSRVEVPAVIGWLRPVVLMPVGALAGLPIDHIEALLAHELAHICRHDYVVNILQRVAEAALFYHPAVWWISGQIRQDREHCCEMILLHPLPGRYVRLTLKPSPISKPLCPARLGPRIGRQRRARSKAGSLVCSACETDRFRGFPFWGPALGVFFFMLVAALAQSAAQSPDLKSHPSSRARPSTWASSRTFVATAMRTALTATVRNLMLPCIRNTRFPDHRRPGLDIFGGLQHFGENAHCCRHRSGFIEADDANPSCRPLRSEVSSHNKRSFRIRPRYRQERPEARREQESRSGVRPRQGASDGSGFGYANAR